VQPRNRTLLQCKWKKRRRNQKSRNEFCTSVDTWNLPIRNTDVMERHWERCI